MPQVTVKDKIKKCAEKLNIGGISMKLLDALIESSQNAIVPDYSDSEKYYIKSIFSGNKSEYAKSINELSDARAVSYNAVQDKMIVQVLLPHHLNNLLYGLIKRKKKYVREPIKQQQGIIDILSSGRLGQVIKTFIDNFPKASESTSKYKDCGFKVTEPIMPYFTGQPLTDKEREALLRYNPELIVLEEKRRNMPKQVILTYCAFLSFMNNDGIIEDCTEYSLLQNVIKEFGENTFCVQTWYNSIDKLLELKLIEKFYDEKKECTCIRVTGIKESIGNRYVLIPFVVFEEDFKKIETAGIKMFFDIAFGLNNGEEKRDNGTIQVVGQEKTYFLKMAKLDTEKQESKEKFERKLLQYKKRYPNELRIAMFGDAAKNKLPSSIDLDTKEVKKFEALAKYFHFSYTSGTAVMVRIRKEYYISKESEKTKRLQTRHRRKIQLIESLLKAHEIEYQQQDILDLLQVFRRTNRRTITLIASIIAERVRLWKDYGWSKIISLGAYARKILLDHQNGALDPEKFTC